MKIRTDFVTNSSSSSFVLARKEEIQQVFKEEYIDKEEQEMIRKALKEGKTVYSGCGMLSGWIA